jgi:pimeloyl-ACP methyl ester carboxylesterase
MTPQFAHSWHAAGRWLPLASLGGDRVHVVTQGSGPSVVLLHGFIQSSWAWRFALDVLARRFTVHAVDLPGCGWSAKPKVSYCLVHQAERIAELLGKLGAESAHLVGNSLGGALALELALLVPHRVGRIVLVNPASPGLYPIALLAAVQHETTAPLLQLPGISKVVQLGLRHVAYARLPIDDAFLQAFLQPLWTPGATHAALQVARHFNSDLRALDRRLHDIPHRTLVLWGREDRMVPLRAVERLTRRLPDALLELFDCSGHCPMEEEPERFCREVLRFLAATDLDTGSPGIHFRASGKGANLHKERAP